MSAALGVLLVGSAWADGSFWVGSICLAVCSLPAGGRAIHLAIVLPSPRRG